MSAMQYAFIAALSALVMLSSCEWLAGMPLVNPFRVAAEAMR